MPATDFEERIAANANPNAAGPNYLRRALAGSLLVWLAFPPVGWSLLAWIAPAVWLTWILPTTIPGRRPYRTLWLAGLVFWALAVHWIRLPHPLNYFGLIALAGYLGLYLPVFVALSRVAVHDWKIPLWLAAPVVWTGLEWLRAHLMTGFLMGSLAHTQINVLPVIQIADLCGEYGVTFLIMLVAASLTKSLATCFDLPSTNRSTKYLLPVLHVLPGTIAIIATLLYGQSRAFELAMQNKTAHALLRIALIQGNTLADWKDDLGRQERIMLEHLELSQDAVAAANATGRPLDLVIWPETAFRRTLVTVAEGYESPADRVHPSQLAIARQELDSLIRQLAAAALVGIDRTHVFPDAEGELDYHSYNSSVLVDSQGRHLGVYDKMHRVVFGEFTPLADWIPFLQRLTPLTGSIEAGQSPTAMQLGQATLSVNICYETTVPHLIRRHVHELTDAGNRPDLLVNLTNDAWFWGSSELDMHLACGIFRAVETRTPLVVAANGGLSAHVNAHGRVLQVTPRQQTAALLVDQPYDPNRPANLTFYTTHGDRCLALPCLLCCVVLTLSRVALRRTDRKS